MILETLIKLLNLKLNNSYLFQLFKNLADQDKIDLRSDDPERYYLIRKSARKENYNVEKSISQNYLTTI